MIYYCDNNRHLVCVPYSMKNLHEMAKQLGIKRCWYHSGNHPHYDIPKLQVKRIQSLCTVVTSKEILSICNAANKSH